MSILFTTGQVSKITGLSRNSIQRCVDDNRIGGFTIPGSEHRRIPKEALIEFMNKHDMKLPHTLLIQCDDRVRVLRHKDEKLVGTQGLVTAITKDSVSVQFSRDSLSVRQIPINDVEIVDG